MGLGFDGGRLHQEPWGSSQYFAGIRRPMRGDGNACWRHFREKWSCVIYLAWLRRERGWRALRQHGEGRWRPAFALRNEERGGV